MSVSIPTPPDATLAKRFAYEQFACGKSAVLYRERLSRLYAVWQGYNRDHVGGALAVPHVGIGRTAPRRFSQCRLTTDYGGRIDITLNEGIVFGTTIA